MALFGLLLFTSVGQAGCAPRVVVVEHARAPCPGGVWIEGHRGPRGHWHPGHWRCPGVVEVVEVE
jgi:hypothetical protein